MPMPFERLRVLNGSSKPVKNITYSGSQAVGVQKATDLLPEQPVAETPPQQVKEGVPVSLEYTDLRTFAITSLEVGSTAALPLWEIYFADEFGTYENIILSVDLYAQDQPDGGNAYYAVARVYFADGSSIGSGGPVIMPCDWFQTHEYVMDPLHVFVLH